MTGKEPLRISARPPDADYPLGHVRAIYFWSFIVALMRFSMGGMLSIYEGIHKMDSGRALEDPWIAIAVPAIRRELAEDGPGAG